MATRIQWTPIGESTVQALTLTEAGTLTRLRGYPETRGDQSFTVGGKSVTISQANYEEYRCELRAVHRDVLASSTYWWGQIHTFGGHFQAGGTFGFELDTAKNRSTALSAATNQGDTTVTLSDSTGFSAGDWVYLEDLNDPRRYDVKRILNPTATTLEDPVSFSYPIGSLFRHWQFLKTCVGIVDSWSFQERDGGRGANLWDLSFSFRTVR